MELDKKNIKKIIGIITFTVVLVCFLNNVNAVLFVAGSIFNLIMPFVVGACIAFILNVPVNFIERKIFTDKKGNKRLKKIARPASIVITLLILILVIFVVIFLVAPQIRSTVIIISDGIPEAYNSILKWWEGLSISTDDIMTSLEEIDLKSMFDSAVAALKTGVGGIFSSTVGIVSGIANVVINIAIGFVFAIYILFQKEKLASQGKKILYAYFPEKVVNKTLHILKLTRTTFDNFISGQCTEAIILGTMFFVCMLFLEAQYALLIGVLIAVTALIPIFGAFAGCFVGCFLLLFVNPVKALWFLIMFFVLQQIEGNLIYPHVVGNSVGLPSIWVLAAVTIGGNLMGVLGMLIFIPLCSVLYALLRENVNNRLKDRKISQSKIL